MHCKLGYYRKLSGIILQRNTLQIHWKSFYYREFILIYFATEMHSIIMHYIIKDINIIKIISL